MKKIMLLGGSAQQVVAIETAKKLGYRTVLCDFLVDNPGQYVADKFYLVSTTDKNAILEVAQKEGIDGIVAYASDPAAPTAAYVSEKMGLCSNPYESVETLCNKDRFRNFLAENGLNTPKANGYSDVEEALDDINNFEFPIIIKPVDSSGSKGVTVLHDNDGVQEALEFAFLFSRSHRIVVEEFVEKKHPYLIGGDIFVQDGKIILWGLLNCHRDSRVNALVPVGKSCPLELADEDVENVKETLQRMVDKLEIRCGAMNVELVMDSQGRVWPIDVGPRNGGNMIPDLLGMIFGVDIVEMTIKAAMGQPIDIKVDKNSSVYYATHNLHSTKNGVYKDILFSHELETYIIKKSLYKKAGDIVEYFDNAAKALGIIFMKFDNVDQMKKILGNIYEHIDIVLE